MIVEGIVWYKSGDKRGHGRVGASFTIMIKDKYCPTTDDNTLGIVGERYDFSWN